MQGTLLVRWAAASDSNEDKCKANTAVFLNQHFPPNTQMGGEDDLIVMLSVRLKEREFAIKIKQWTICFDTIKGEWVISHTEPSFQNCRKCGSAEMTMAVEVRANTKSVQSSRPKERARDLPPPHNHHSYLCKVRHTHEAVWQKQISASTAEIKTLAEDKQETDELLNLSWTSLCFLLWHWW